jgi:hypothetical protein
VTDCCVQLGQAALAHRAKKKKKFFYTRRPIERENVLEKVKEVAEFGFSRENVRLSLDLS